jgi:hypothetical protein
MPDSDYIVYVDESGDPSLTAINPQYPIFVVAFCIINKTQYIDAVGKLLKLKFDTFGHDMVVMHEREIRKGTGDFAFIKSDPARGQQFLTDVTTFVQDAPFTLIAAVIRKNALINQYRYPDNPYEMALTFCLERTHLFLQDLNQQTHNTHVVVESRGKKEDKDLELAFRRTCDGENYFHSSLPFTIRFSHKLCNSTGTQLADLVARPIGQEVLNPGSQARIYPAIRSKFRRNAWGYLRGPGLKIFP